MRKLKNAELHRIDIQSYKKAVKTPLIIVLADVRSMHNVGSIFRTADAFLIQKIYLCGITATPPHRDIQKTALGATESVDWAFAPSATALIAALKADGVRLVAVEQLENATPLPAYQPDSNRSTALIFGHEVKGVSQKLADRCEAGIEIPQFGTKHSLNIAVAVGIVLWDLFSKMQRR
ncbi:MAG: RNA methyltransferase [Flavobacteriales bacterium]